MAEAQVQLNPNVAPGAKVKTFTSVDGGGNTVHVQATATVDTSGVPVNVATTNDIAALQAVIAGVKARLYDLSNAATIYIGTAELGTAADAAAWRIKRVFFDGSGNPTETRWSAATAVWDNRIGETYT